MYWCLHFPPPFSCLMHRRIRNLLKYLLFVFIYVAESRKSETRRVTDPSANQQRAVQLVIKMAAVKEEYYKDPHYSFINLFIYLYCLVDNALKMGGYKVLNINTIFIIPVNMILVSISIIEFLFHNYYYFNFILNFNFKYDNIYYLKCLKSRLSINVYNDHKMKVQSN